MESSAALIGLVFGIIIGAVISGAIIWLVGKMNLGLTVKNFGWAMLAGLVIGFFTTLVTYFLPDMGSAVSFAVNLLVSAVVIMAAGQVLKGLTVDGFKGGLFAAIAIAVISVLIALLLGGSVST